MEEIRRQKISKEEEIRARKFAEVIKLALESKDQKYRPHATTELVKPRFPPI